MKIDVNFGAKLQLINAHRANLSVNNNQKSSSNVTSCTGWQNTERRIKQNLIERKKNEEKKQYNTGVISWFFLSLFALHGVSLITTQSHV
jgi:hypothetical protein